MKRFKIYLLLANSLLLFILIICLFIIIKRQNAAYVSMPSLIDELPLIDRNYLVKIKMGNDSIIAFFDTGASCTEFLLPEVHAKIGKSSYRVNTNEERILIKQLYFELDTMYLGNTKFVQKGSYVGKDLLHAYDRNILGSDLFSHFVWKLDHLHQKIYFSQDSAAFSGNHAFSISFTTPPKDGRPRVEGTINGKKYLFLLDTGHPGFIHIKDESVQNTINWNGGTYIDYLQNNYFFQKEKEDKKQYQIADAAFDKLFFKDEIIEYNQLRYNLIGQDFFKRFEYVIIDYLHHVIHFGPMRYKSFFYLRKLRENINSIGIEINSFNFPQIIGVSEKMEKAGICLGDTIVKIDGLPVSENPDLIAFSTLENPAVPPTSLAYLQYIKDEAVITIKKNGKEQDFRLQREHYVNEPDTVNSYEGPFLQPYPIYKSFEPILVDSATQERKPGWRYKGGIYMRYINNKK
ncbi:hypothetical protein [Parabacteroides pacaensis]|uniref:hypothetical protein n=1 Tax=Parabacteroides pacaensis TaxID=2086575 RepID=UPI000D103547|nr:hypothetical protein [Parabacteroides pacaensis]